MKTTRLPSTDSIEELARFWDEHDLTDFEDQLEEVAEPVFTPPLRPGSGALDAEVEPGQGDEGFAPRNVG